MHRSSGVRPYLSLRQFSSMNILLHYIPYLNYLKIKYLQLHNHTLPTKKVTTYYLISRLDLIIKDSTSECIVLLKSILFKTSLNLTQLFLQLTYSLQEGSVLPLSTKTCLGTMVTWWTSTQSIIPANLHTVILVGLKQDEVIPTVRYLEKS